MAGEPGLREGVRTQIVNKATAPLVPTEQVGTPDTRAVSRRGVVARRAAAAVAAEQTQKTRTLARSEAGEATLATEPTAAEKRTATKNRYEAARAQIKAENREKALISRDEMLTEDAFGEPITTEQAVAAETDATDTSTEVTQLITDAVSNLRSGVEPVRPPENLTEWIAKLTPANAVAAAPATQTNAGEAPMNAADAAEANDVRDELQALQTEPRTIRRLGSNLPGIGRSDSAGGGNGDGGSDNGNGKGKDKAAPAAEPDDPSSETSTRANVPLKRTGPPRILGQGRRAPLDVVTPVEPPSLAAEDAPPELAPAAAAPEPLLAEPAPVVATPTLLETAPVVEAPRPEVVAAFAESTATIKPDQRTRFVQAVETKAADLEGELARAATDMEREALQTRIDRLNEMKAYMNDGIVPLGIFDRQGTKDFFTTVVAEVRPPDGKPAPKVDGTPPGGGLPAPVPAEAPLSPSDAGLEGDDAAHKSAIDTAVDFIGNDFNRRSGESDDDYVKRLVGVQKELGAILRQEAQDMDPVVAATIGNKDATPDDKLHTLGVFQTVIDAQLARGDLTSNLREALELYNEKLAADRKKIEHDRDATAATAPEPPPLTVDAPAPAHDLGLTDDSELASGPDSNQRTPSDMIQEARDGYLTLAGETLDPAERQRREDELRTDIADAVNLDLAISGRGMPPASLDTATNLGHEVDYRRNQANAYKDLYLRELRRDPKSPFLKLLDEMGQEATAHMEVAEAFRTFSASEPEPSLVPGAVLAPAGSEPAPTATVDTTIAAPPLRTETVQRRRFLGIPIPFTRAEPVRRGRNPDTADGLWDDERPTTPEPLSTPRSRGLSRTRKAAYAAGGLGVVGTLFGGGVAIEHQVGHAPAAPAGIVAGQEDPSRAGAVASPEATPAVVATPAGAATPEASPVATPQVVGDGTGMVDVTASPQGAGVGEMPTTGGARGEGLEGSTTETTTKVESTAQVSALTQSEVNKLVDKHTKDLEIKEGSSISQMMIDAGIVDDAESYNTQFYTAAKPLLGSYILAYQDLLAANPNLPPLADTIQAFNDAPDDAARDAIMDQMRSALDTVKPGDVITVPDSPDSATKLANDAIAAATANDNGQAWDTFNEELSIAMNTRSDREAQQVANAAIDQSVAEGGIQPSAADEVKATAAADAAKKAEASNKDNKDDDEETVPIVPGGPSNGTAGEVVEG